MGRSSSASSGRRQQLIRDYVIVPEINNTIPVRAYLNYAKNLYDEGLALFEAGDFDRSYVAYKKYSEIVTGKLPSHVSYPMIIAERTNLVHYLKLVVANLEVIVAAMDKEEEERIANSEALQLIEAFEEGGMLEKFEEVFSHPDDPYHSNSGSLKVNGFHKTSSEKLLAGSKDIDLLENSWARPPDIPLAAVKQKTFQERMRFLSEREGAPSHDYNGTGKNGEDKWYVPVPRLLQLGESGCGKSNPASLKDRMLGTSYSDIAIISELEDFKSFPIPQPTSHTVELKIGTKAHYLNKDDFQVSYAPFLRLRRSDLLMERSAIETNRCFFLHLGVAMRIHPFGLQVVFRHIAALRLKDIPQDDISYELLNSVQLYAGYVDANCLLYLWPEEFDHCRICFISGPFSRPIFSCFVSEDGIKSCGGERNLRDVIIHCNGSHFTLLSPPPSYMMHTQFKILSSLLESARTAGLIVQTNLVKTEGKRYSVMDALKDLQNAAAGR